MNTQSVNEKVKLNSTEQNVKQLYVWKIRVNLIQGVSKLVSPQKWKLKLKLWIFSVTNLCFHFFDENFATCNT